MKMRSLLFRLLVHTKAGEYVCSRRPRNRLPSLRPGESFINPRNMCTVKSPNLRPPYFLSKITEVKSEKIRKRSCQVIYVTRCCYFAFVCTAGHEVS